MLKAQNWHSPFEKLCSLEQLPQIILCAWMPKIAAGQPEAS
jgi:hypothetical protein